jgi:hypothetical protein
VADRHSNKNHHNKIHRRILLCQLLRVAGGEGMDARHINARVDEVNAMLKDPSLFTDPSLPVGLQQRVQLVETALPCMPGGKPDKHLYLSDGLHLSGKGYQVLLGQLSAALGVALGDAPGQGKDEAKAALKARAGDGGGGDGAGRARGPIQTQTAGFCSGKPKLTQCPPVSSGPQAATDSQCAADAPVHARASKPPSVIEGKRKKRQNRSRRVQGGGWAD